MFIEMKVAGITLDPMTKMPIVILKDSSGENALPIWIGIAEASAIATQLEKIDLARPMTHDLLRNVLNELDVNLEKVEVTDLKDNTYFAILHLKVGDETLPVDSRPSDAIAFVRQESKRMAPPAVKCVANGLRSLLRFCECRGEAPAGLAASVPSVATWTTTPPIPKAIAAEHAQRAKTLENRVETVYREALADLFDGPAGPKRVINILKMREVYRHLSNAADRGDEAANIISDIVVKMT